MKTYLIDGQRDFPVLRIRKNSNGTVLIAPICPTDPPTLGEQYLVANSRLYTPKEREPAPRPTFNFSFWRPNAPVFYTAVSEQ